MWYKNVGTSLLTLSQITRLSDRQTDRQTAFSWLDNRACSVVKCLRFAAYILLCLFYYSLNIFTYSEPNNATTANLVFKVLQYRTDRLQRIDGW